MTETTPRAEADAIIERLSRLDIAQAIEPDTALNVEAALYAFPEGRKLVDLTDRLDALDNTPRFRRGTANHETLDSLIAHTRRFRDHDSAGFVSPAGGNVTTVLDYNGEGGPGDKTQRWGKHRAKWVPKAHEAWTRWARKNEETLTPQELGEHLEAAALDLIDPPSTEGSDRDRELITLAERMHVKFGAPAEIIGLARDFKIRTESETAQVQALQSGETHVVFKEDHLDAAGAKLVVPGMFLIAIPVFDGDPQNYRIAVKLRYRKKNQSVVWSYSLHAWQDVERAAWAGIARQLAERVALPETDPETGEILGDAPAPFPVFIGRPEGVGE